MSELVSLRFVRSDRVYKAGDIAGFSAGEAQKYLKTGCAVLLNPPEEKPAKKPAAKRPAKKRTARKRTAKKK